MIEFKKYVREENALTSLGTLKAIAGKGGSIGLIAKNVADNSKRIAVIVTNAKGESATIACSKAVSAALRSKTMNVAQLAGLEVLEGKNAEGEERAFVSMPANAGTGVATIAVDKIKVEAVEATTFANVEELIAF